MKKILFVLLITLLAAPVFAQKKTDTDSPHLTFAGVPIDGAMKDFILQLKKKGFVVAYTGDGSALLKGTFAGYKSCEIYVFTGTRDDLVTDVYVQFPKCENWGALSGNYFYLQRMLTDKYGYYTSCVEEFTGNTWPETDSAKMHEMRQERCNYKTTFELEKGVIVLNMIHNDLSQCHVVLYYYDDINHKKARSAVYDDL